RRVSSGPGCACRAWLCGCRGRQLRPLARSWRRQRGMCKQLLDLRRAFSWLTSLANGSSNRGRGRRPRRKEGCLLSGPDAALELVLVAVTRHHERRSPTNEMQRDGIVLSVIQCHAEQLHERLAVHSHSDQGMELADKPAYVWQRLTDRWHAV